jgi:inorganic phosphate transporter, PiT family
MENTMLFILFTLLMAFIFDFINGFHDAANSIATIVTTGVLTPKQAVLWAAFFNFIAFMFFNLMVAKTVGSGLINTDLIDAHIVCAALLGAIFWNLLTWYYGLPSSSTHALIGGMAGAAVAKAGMASLNAAGFTKVALGIVLSPILGLVFSLPLVYAFNQLMLRQGEKKLHPLFKGLQLFSSAMLSMTHGSNDAQKTMGIIAILLFSSSWIHGEFYIPLWVIISCQAVISLGTLAGGWRIVNTMGTKITSLNPMKGTAAETGAALTIFIATEFGIPVSTTHTVTGAIAGVGLIDGLSGLSWMMLGKIVISWILTIPASALIAATLMYFFH